MEIKLLFKDSGAISKSTYGQDALMIDIKEKSFFISAETKEFMKDSGMSFCPNGASMCKLVPPIIENESEIETLESASETLETSFKLVSLINIVFLIFFGGIVQQLLGFVKVL
jgi:hypothetical protein